MKRRLREAEKRNILDQELLASLVSLPEEKAHALLRDNIHARVSSGNDKISRNNSLPLMDETAVAVEPHESEPEQLYSKSSNHRAEGTCDNLANVDAPHAISNARDRDVKEIILRALISKNDLESSAVMARLRLGHNWQDLADDVVRGHYMGTHKTE